MESWTSLKSQLRILLDDFLAGCDNDLGEMAAGGSTGDDPSGGGPPSGEVDEIHLPPHLYCVCLGEPDLGLCATNIPCSRCGQVEWGSQFLCLD
jgi:hypothetical protein